MSHLLTYLDLSFDVILTVLIFIYSIHNKSIPVFFKKGEFCNFIKTAMFLLTKNLNLYKQDFL